MPLRREPTSKEEGRPQHVERKLNVVQLERLIGLCARALSDKRGEKCSGGKLHSRSRGGHGSIERSNSEVGGVAHETIKDSPDLG